jgi:hypothetical protein
MEKQEFNQTVFLPNLDEFTGKYPRYSGFATGEGRFLYELIMRPSVVIRAQAASYFGYPSVLAVAEDCRRVIEAQDKVVLDNFTKQFIGSVICALMEANGFKKTGTKRSVPHESFKTGEYYVVA